MFLFIFFVALPILYSSSNGDLDGYYVWQNDTYKNIFNTEIVEIRNEKVYVSRYPWSPTSFMHFHVGTLQLQDNTLQIAIDTTLIISLNTGQCYKSLIGCGDIMSFDIDISGNLTTDRKASYRDPLSGERVKDAIVKCIFTKVDSPDRNVDWPKDYLNRGILGKRGECDTFKN